MLQITTHNLIMNEIVKKIYSNTKIAPLLGFKGGTALYMFYNLPRFSVDLDFDLLNQSKKDIVFTEVTKIVSKLGVLTEHKEKHFNLYWLLSYKKGEKHLKVEITKRSFGSSYELKNSLGIPALVMKKEDMFANKLTALLERRKLANRDIFDIWFMLKNGWSINDALLKERTKMDAKKYLKKCLKLLEENPPKYPLENLGDLVDNKTKDFIKRDLIKDTIFYLKANFLN